MKRRSKIDFEAYGKRYGVCSRTTRRWHKQGANLNDPESIANVILRQRNPKTETLKILTETLHE
jgi:hypothetical protein